MMGTKIRNFTPLPDLSLEEFVPNDNFYRHLEETLDLSFVREMVEDRYAPSDRPSVDPLVFFKLQLVLFFERLRSERQLMAVVADRLSIRWYLGYDLYELLPDHSSLTRIRDRYGLEIFQRFFEEMVEMCAEALSGVGRRTLLRRHQDRGERLGRESITPRFAVEQHLQDLLEEDPRDPDGASGDAARATAAEDLDLLPTSEDAQLVCANAAKSD